MITTPADHPDIRPPVPLLGGDPNARRSGRVTLLTLAMILMGLADLQLTLTYMRSAGMIELNPIAREMIELGGSRQLIAYKMFTIVASAGLLYIIRRHRLAEQCAWLSCGVLLALTFHWVRYNEHVTADAFAAAPVMQISNLDHRWVMLRD